MKPKVKIIILNWNGKKYLKNCLDALFENTSYSNFDVTVVDNGSNDGSADLVKEEFEDVNIIENNRNLGFSIGNNIGIQENPGFDYYLLLNNDTEPKDGWLTEMVRVAEREGAGIVGSKLLYPDKTVQHAGATYGKEGPEHIGRGENPDKFTEDREVEFVTGASFMINSEVIEDIGYLDEIFTPAMYEETDYCKRARKSGFSIYFASKSVLIHHEGKTQEKENTSRFRYFIGRKNSVKYNIMNAERANILRGLYVEAKYMGASIIGYGRNPKKELIKAYLEVIRDLPKLIYKRFNRKEHVPSYYCEDIKDYSRRY